MLPGKEGILILTNTVKRKLQNGQTSIGTWITIPSPAVAEILASAGFDWLIVDAEHGPHGLETASMLFQAMKGTPATPLIRVPWNDQVMVKRVLDAGAMGVMFPMIRSRTEAEAAVRACKYPPEGIRGLGAGRALGYGLRMEEYLSVANDEIMVIVQVEHYETVERIDEILSVPGVDLAFVGPYDLSASMGIVGEVGHPKVTEAIQTVIDACRRHGMPAGILAGTPAAAKQRIAQGFQFIALGFDSVFLGAAAAEAVRQTLI